MAWPNHLWLSFNGKPKLFTKIIGKVRTDLFIAREMEYSSAGTWNQLYMRALCWRWQTVWWKHSIVGDFQKSAVSDWSSLFSPTPACPQTHTQRWKDTDHLEILDTQSLWRYRLRRTHTAVSDSVCKTKTLTWFTIQHVFTTYPRMHMHIQYTQTQAYVWSLC